MKMIRVSLIVLAFLFSSMSVSWAQAGGALSFATGWQKKLGSELSLKPAWQKKPASGLSLKPGSQKKPGSGLSLANGWQQKMEWQNKKDQLDLGYYEVAQAQGQSGAGAKPGDPQAEGGGTFASVDEAARKSSNPLGGDFIIILNQFDNYFMQGDATNKTRHVNTWAIQPVIPIPMKNVIGENWIWVNRPTFPIIFNADVPDVAAIKAGLTPGGGPPQIPSSFPAGGAPFTSASGFGDIVYFSLLGQSLPTEMAGGGDLVWGVGPTFTFPTASDDQLGSGKFSVGPSWMAAFIGKKFIVGGLYQQWMSYADGGNGSGNNVNFSWFNLFYFLNLENGWQIGGTPVITADWEASSSNRWTVPIGLGVYKTSIVAGKLPLKVGVEFQYMPKRPDALGQEFNIRLVIAPILPSPFGK